MAIAEQLSDYAKKDKTSVIGLSSGMSMDGVDLAHVEISGAFPNLTIDLVGTHYEAFTKEFRTFLLEARDGHVSDVARADVEVADVFSECVATYLSKSKIPKESIDAIGSHGQAIYGDLQSDGKARTIQVGSGSFIASRTGILTVFNFRMRDIAVGGRAAPLTPLLDYVLYRKPGEVIALNNLGSISNSTMVTEKLEDVVGSDLGPANMPIDFFASQVPHGPGFDKDGALSGKGKVLDDVLQEMLALPFIQKPIPKTAGYGDFGPKILQAIQEKHKNKSLLDLTRTALEFSAQATANAYNQVLIPQFPQLQRILFSGGGVHNRTLMGRLQDLLPGLQIESLAQSDKMFSDAKEAILFALLAHETLHGRPGNLPQVTGASRRTILGEIAPGE